MEITRTKDELKSLTRVVNKSLLSRIFLIQSNVERSIDAETYDRVNGEVQFEGDLIDCSDEYFNSKVSLTVKGLNGDGVVIVKVCCDYMLTYKMKANAELSKEDLKNFSNTNALYNAWPYVREFVQAMCNRMEIPPMTLPLLRIVPERTVAKAKKAIPQKKPIKKSAPTKKATAPK
ncbi:hypothetical protein Dvar_11390 [Desulfosarcina variabilis str. Montpellier]|uniref:hypothetical protein n=1 Tax=Desulfosarcina variabilis TaxID=2300 RepID=UPI003AFAEFF1